MSDLVSERTGPTGDVPVVLLHAGVADRRMWDPVWPGLVARRDAVRLDLRGYGDSVERPGGPLAAYRDVLGTLMSLGIDRAHLVGASYGAGVAVEVALADPARVASLLLVAPGGSLIPAMTEDLRAFAVAEDAALSAGDLDAAVEANLATWVDGPGQARDRVAPDVRARVGEMQRRAFELTADWDDVVEEEPDPPALERLGEVAVPTLVLNGALDLDAIDDAAAAVLAGVPGSRQVLWPDVAHLPSLEHPDAFAALLADWLAEVS